MLATGVDAGDAGVTTTGTTSVVEAAAHAVRSRVRDHPRAAAALVVLVVAFGIGWRLNPGPLGIAGDSATYIGVSNNIVEGKGATSPFVNEWDELTPEQAVAVRGRSPSVLWPPGYPVAIAAVAHLGLTVVDAARWLSVLSLVIMAVGSGWLASRLARGSPGAMLAAGLFVAVSPCVDTLTTLVYSDVFAAAVSTLAVMALVKAFDGRPPWLPAFWVLAVATSLIRVGGLTLIAVGVVLVALCYPAPRRSRLVAAAALASGVVPIVAWRIHVAMALGGTPSTFSFHPRWETVAATPGLLWQYLVPDELGGSWRPVPVIAVIVLTALAVVHLGLRRWRPTRRRPLVERMPLVIVLTTIVGYVASTLVAAFWFGALLSVDTRTYLSVVPLLTALVMAVAYGLVEGARPGPAPVAPVTITGAPAAATNTPTAGATRWAGVVPLAAVGLIVGTQAATGWSSLIGHPPEHLTHVIGAPDDAQLGEILSHYDLIVSNDPSQLYVVTGLSSITPPTWIRPSTLEPNPDHDAQLADLGRLLREQHGAFVAFVAPDFFGSHTFLDGPTLVDRLGLEPVGRSSAGTSIVYAPKPSTA